MRHLDLFSGIGGFALAARWVGWDTIGFCEIDPWCRKVLAKHWPGVPIYDDVRQITAHQDKTMAYTTRKRFGAGWARGTVAASENGAPAETATVGPVDVITGGFPCQDISYAGKGAGIDGERSGLWTELARIIGEVRPRYAVLENVAALLSRGLDRVAGDLAEIGYDCEWHCIPASAVGAPHRRDRIWIICYPNSDSEPVSVINAEASGLQGDVADTDEPGPQGYGAEHGLRKNSKKGEVGGCGNVAQPTGERPPRPRQSVEPINPPTPAIGQAIELVDGRIRNQWAIEPELGRVAHGIPARVDRLRGLGNAIVPQVAQILFEAINEQD